MTKSRLLLKIESTVLYNCELWTLTQSLADQIHIIQCQLIIIKWFKTITNKEVYSLSKPDQSVKS